MTKYPICQCCAAPLGNENRGTNRNGSLNEDYCRACYVDGEFTDHSLTLHQLEVRLMEMAEVHNEISLEEANEIIRKLPDLKRWQMSNI
ncbi:hypothetical protein FHG64_03645 [Antarcticibacterium flavum]|uniref:Putative zinc ribbon domain-containing protein n=1 Tax=Antarcticibacterium flavum TaxID=2058175 RepID=A0A5B7X1M8_9FLAO|nr:MULTISPECIES: zinc ribbon domain-containing protein [Antarcticibacterium]MCM4158705.1 hypothetical protein [Antarcticibacterium sp. W02-3]QCY68558.1 hypothetical protein FHG64_03645 [Antarcticibacterium flavum]